MTTKIKHLTPNAKYLTKLRIELSLIAALVLIGGFVLGILIALGEGFTGFIVTFFITFFANMIWWVPGMFLSGPYYRSLRYEVHEDEMIVYAGIWTKSVKHVPFRTVTNLTVKQGLLDRWMGLGSLEIQTAGMSGQTGEPEQKLVGLEDAQSIYEMVATTLHRFRGAMSPTTTEEEGEAVATTPGSATLNALLEEVRAIRELIIASK